MWMHNKPLTIAAVLQLSIHRAILLHLPKRKLFNLFNYLFEIQKLQERKENLIV